MLETATLAAGCFWCYEPIFKQLKGVQSVTVGYAGGQTQNPTYEQVTGGNTGHAEAFQVKYNPDVITFEDLLTVFWNVHDPTTLNRQGNDIGTQYRSAIFYMDDNQKQIAEQSKQQMDASGQLAGSIVTEIMPFTSFYHAEDYHQDYFSQNPEQAYCSVVIRPKVEKFEHLFKDRVK